MYQWLGIRKCTIYSSLGREKREGYSRLGEGDMEVEEFRTS